MRDCLKQLAGVVAVIGLAVACSSSGGDIGEPNNSILESGMLESGKSYTMKIDSVGDIDWYSVPVPGQGYLNISTKTVPDNLNLQLRFAEKQEWEPEKQKWMTGWSDIPKTIAVLDPDTLYFVIADNYNDEASDEEVEFKTEFIEEFDEYEPNDEPDNAVSVSSGEVMETAFFPKTDVDWFKIKVEELGYLMLQARSVPDDITVNARYAKRKDAFGKAEYISGWQKLPAGIQVTEEGEYYFTLVDDYNDAMSREKAVWKIDYIAEVDSTEPNNSFEEAYSVSIGDTVKAAIFPKGDEDYFTLTPDSKLTIRLAAQHPDNIKPEVKLYVIEDFEEKAIGSWEKLPTQLQLERDRKYYFVLVDDYNDEYSMEPVTLRIFEVEGDETGTENDTDE